MRDKNEPRWWKSSYSGSKSGECVEVAEGRCHMHLRDSRILALVISPSDPGSG